MPPYWNTPAGMWSILWVWIKDTLWSPIRDTCTGWRVWCTSIVSRSDSWEVHTNDPRRSWIRIRHLTLFTFGVKVLVFPSRDFFWRKWPPGWSVFFQFILWYSIDLFDLTSRVDTSFRMLLFKSSTVNKENLQDVTETEKTCIRFILMLFYKHAWLLDFLWSQLRFKIHCSIRYLEWFILHKTNWDKKSTNIALLEWHHMQLHDRLIFHPAVAFCYRLRNFTCVKHGQWVHCVSTPYIVYPA